MLPLLPRATRSLRAHVFIPSVQLSTRARRKPGPAKPPEPNQQPPPPSSPPSSDENKTSDVAGKERPSFSSLLAQTSDQDNSLLAPVRIPEDPNAVLKSDHPARNLLAESGIVVQRQIEMMNIFLGFEQANRYVILDPHGNHIGYMAEHTGGTAKAMGRQFFHTHRSFTTHIFDRHSREVLRVRALSSNAELFTNACLVSSTFLMDQYQHPRLRSH